jgi:hypothetical protein
VFDIGQLDIQFLQSAGLEDESQAINGELKIAVGGGVMLLLYLIQIIVNLICIQFGGNPIKMEGQLGDVSSIVGERGGGFPGKGDFLAKFLIELSKPFYPGASLLDQVLILFFFFITLSLRNGDISYETTGRFSATGVWLNGG